MIGHRPCGLYSASQIASAAFGAVCGSGPATIATIGSIALPEMKKHNYDLTVGAVGSILVLAVCLARRRLTWKTFWASLCDTAKTVGMIMYLIAAATTFSRFIAVSTLSSTISTAVTSANAPPAVIMAGIFLVFVIGGCFIDGPALTLLLAPVFYPVVTGTFGYSGVWFGIILLLLGLVGGLTPPVGVSVYVAKGLLPETRLEDMFKSIWPFVAALLATVLICCAFPQIITFLPSLMKV